MNMENLIGETTEYDKKAALEVRKPKSWCKSVSAFANTLGGALIFGMADDGQIVGLTEPESELKESARSQDAHGAYPGVSAALSQDRGRQGAADP